MDKLQTPVAPLVKKWRYYSSSGNQKTSLFPGVPLGQQ